MPASVTPDTRKPDLATVLAIAVFVYVLGKVVHEGLGHGGACIVVGADLRGWSTAWCDCVGDAQWRGRLVKAAGTLANLGAGGLLALAFAQLRALAPTRRYALWLGAVVQLGLGFGYLLVDPVAGLGDWGGFLEGLPGRAGWRIALTAVGAIGYSLTIRFAHRGLAHFSSTEDARAVGKRLALVPYLAVGGAFMTAAALRNVLGPAYAFSSAMATLGGTSLLAWCWTLPRAPGLGPGLPIARSPAWIVVGVLTAIVTIVWLGPGLRG